MPRLPRTQEMAYRRVLDVAASGLPPERLARKLIDAIRIAIPSDGYRLLGIDPATGLVNRLLAASEADSWAHQAWLRDAYLSYQPVDYLELSNLMAAGIRASAVHDRQEACWGYPPHLLASVSPSDHQRRFHELESPVGGGIQAIVQAHGRWVAAMQLYRRDSRAQFRPTDVAFIHHIAPIVGEAIGASLARERALQADSTGNGDTSGVLVLSAGGTINFATAAGELWFDRLRSADAVTEGSIPTAIWAALAKLRTVSDESPVGQVMADLPTGSVRIEATPGGDGQSVAVVLTPVRPPVMPEVPVTWPLTRQERAIVTLLLRGAGNREIANALSIGDHTVETHLRNVYEKLDAHGRGQLLARFFRETFLPPITAAGEPER